MAKRKKAESQSATPSASVRFVATLGPASYSKAVSAAADLDLDRLPDSEGKVRVLLTPDDARRLLEQGYQVHLSAAIPVAPLDPKLVTTDSQAKSWLAQRVKGVPKKGGR